MWWQRKLATKQKTEEEEWRHQTGFEFNGDTGTKDTETQATKVRACGVDDNSRLPAKALATSVAGTRSQGRQMKQR